MPAGLVSTCGWDKVLLGCSRVRAPLLQSPATTSLGAKGLPEQSPPGTDPAQESTKQHRIILGDARVGINANARGRCRCFQPSSSNVLWPAHFLCQWPPPPCGVPLTPLHSLPGAPQPWVCVCVSASHCPASLEVAHHGTAPSLPGSSSSKRCRLSVNSSRFFPIPRRVTGRRLGWGGS